MHYDRIDHVILPAASLDELAAPFQRLGLTLTPGVRHRGRGTENRAFFIGGGSTEFYIELLGITDAEAARRSQGEAFLQACAESRGLTAVTLSVRDMRGTLAALAERSIHASASEVFADEGRKICDVARLDITAQALVDLRLVAYVERPEERAARHEAAGLFRHTFPVRRLDHLAVVAPSLDETTGFWTDSLGVPVTGEVVTPTMIIRQLRIGDAVLELLGPATPDSVLARRPPGLVSMVAVEVEDLEAAVAQARAAGFSAPDAVTGVLPGTRTATIPAGELSGMALQLLQYV